MSQIVDKIVALIHNGAACLQGPSFTAEQSTVAAAASAASALQEFQKALEALQVFGQRLTRCYDESLFHSSYHCNVLASLSVVIRRRPSCDGCNASDYFFMNRLVLIPNVQALLLSSSSDAPSVFAVLGIAILFNMALAWHDVAAVDATSLPVTAAMSSTWTKSARCYDAAIHFLQRVIIITTTSNESMTNNDKNAPFRDLLQCWALNNRAGAYYNQYKLYHASSTVADRTKLVECADALRYRLMILERAIAVRDTTGSVMANVWIEKAELNAMWHNLTLLQPNAASAA